MKRLKEKNSLPYPVRNSTPRRIYITLSLLIICGSPLSAQTVVDQVDQMQRRSELSRPQFRAGETTQAPLLFEDELEDIGPQFLLLESARHKPSRIVSDLQFAVTSNATLNEENPESSTVAILMNEYTFSLEPEDWRNGKLGLVGGIRHFIYRYGLPNSDNKLIDETPVDTNDFDAIQPFASITHVRGKNTIALEIHYLEMKSRSTDATIYREAVPALRVSRALGVQQSSHYLIQYQGNFRETKTETGELLPEDWNNRTDHALSLFYSQEWGKLFFQPSYRFQFSHYTHSDRDRNDFYNTFAVAVLYRLKPYLVLRFFSSYELRDSTEPETLDYKVGDAGFGGAVNIKF